jgi:hypothetical protein
MDQGSWLAGWVGGGLESETGARAGERQMALAPHVRGLCLTALSKQRGWWQVSLHHPAPSKCRHWPLPLAAGRRAALCTMCDQCVIWLISHIPYPIISRIPISHVPCPMWYCGYDMASGNGNGTIYHMHLCTAVAG